MDLMDELYGNLDEKPAGTPLHHNEDSLDIYSGLENSPKDGGHREKVSPMLSPHTMESMDIYEEIIREEQEEKEATYNELKGKFADAQKQVKELLSKLQLLESKNSSLNSENTLLKKNICSLIKTARMEIVRKDEEISRLSNRSGRGSYGPNFHRPQMESSPASTRHSLINATCSALEGQGVKQDNVMNEVNRHKGRNTATKASTAASQPFEVLQRCHRTDFESTLHRQNKSAAKPSRETLTVQTEQEFGPVHSDRTSEKIKNPDTVAYTSGPRITDAITDCRVTNLKDNNNCPSKQTDNPEKPQKCLSGDKKCNSKDKDWSLQNRVDINTSKSGRTEKERSMYSSVSSENKTQLPEVPIILKSSEQSKNPSSQLHKGSTSIPSQLSKGSVKTAADVEKQSKEHVDKQNVDRTCRETGHSGLSTTCSVVDEANHSQNYKGKKRDGNWHERREEKSSTEERSSKAKRDREYEQKRAKESDRSKRDEGNSCCSGNSSKERRRNRSESSKGYEQKSTKEKDRKDDDKRSMKQVDASDGRQPLSSPKLDFQRKDVYKRKSSNRIDEASSESKRSYSNDKSRKMEDLKYHKNGNSDKNYFRDKDAEKDRERKRRGHLEKQRTQKHGESKNALTKDDGPNSPKKHAIVRKGEDGKNEQDKNLEYVHVDSTSVVTVSTDPCKTTEDNSPERKLSFMETLNLTLSPLKKQKQFSDPKEPIGATSEDASLHNSRFSDAGEEFFVIDELKNSQHSVEEIDVDPEVTTVADLTSSHKQFGDVFDVASEAPSAENTDKEAQKENVTKDQEAVDLLEAIVKKTEEKKCETLDSNVSDKHLSKLTLRQESPNCVHQNHNEDLLEITDNAVVLNATKTALVGVSDNTPDSVVDGCQQQDLFVTVSNETSLMEIQRNPQAVSQDPLLTSNGICQDDVSSSDKAQNIPTINSSGSSESPINVEVSSSTTCADLDDPIKVRCDVERTCMSEQDKPKTPMETFEISKNIEKQNSSENVKMSENPLQSPLWSQNITAPYGRTAVEKVATSSSQSGFSEPDSTEKEEQIPKSSNPVVFCHDEDSMMLTLKNIRVIPEAISPLTSPVRQVKKVQPQHAEKQPHVKSLNKDLSTVTSESDKNGVTMDMNKENKSPDSSVTGSSNKVTKDALVTSGTEDDELEDGEIVSESEEEGPLFIQTPPREKDKTNLGTHKSPKLSAVGKRVSQKKSCIPAKYSEQGKSSKSSSANNSPTSSKRRFKTVSPTLKAAVYTIDEFMEMLGSIRIELRKKYMKLQKNVTKTAFGCIVDMSHASFTEFINAVDLDKLCCHSKDIKSRLNTIIMSIMSKVTKNGIVNRIFEQRAGDLKQKLWTFVDGQFDFLFKELKTVLRSVSEPCNNPSIENKNLTLNRKEVESEVVEKEPFSTSGHLHIAKKSKVDKGSVIRDAPPHYLPRRGLGSRGKNIKAIMNEDDQPTKVMTSHQPATSSAERSVHESTSGPENRSLSYVRRLSHNGSIQDKSDFELLTEQQTSSLTFNLVSDSQMGEIFKCLLQGSDLLEASGPMGENTSWPLSTPRKEGLSGDSLIGIMTPNKTPFKSIASWSAFSPYKFVSNSKLLVDPAILDESCLLEVPSNSEPCPLPHQSTTISQRSFSILAEDLAVSLTIPSPLKSDSHLSFLHPGTGQPLSAPNSVLSAHYSEDALLDGEDATEQDIHLSLDTDNSSSGSSPSRTWDGSDPSAFQFQPTLPMQAVVMERSNDHFIVRIRRTSSGPNESKQNEGKAISTLAKCPEESLKPNITLTHKDLGSTPEMSSKNPTKENESCHESDEAINVQTLSQKSSFEGVSDDQSTSKNAESVSKEACFRKSTALEENSATETETSEKVPANVRNTSQSPSAPESEPERASKKRKERHSEPKAKRPKVEKSQNKHSKSRHKKRSKPSKEKGLKTAVPQVSPSSLSAKNVIRKKGEVVVTWTRDEDRDILIELKMKGPSPNTFASLSKRLKKSAEQIEERFSQLMKLFKKKEKMEN